MWRVDSRGDSPAKRARFTASHAVKWFGASLIPASLKLSEGAVEPNGANQRGVSLAAKMEFGLACSPPPLPLRIDAAGWSVPEHGNVEERAAIEWKCDCVPADSRRLSRGLSLSLTFRCASLRGPMRRVQLRSVDSPCPR